MITTKPQVDMKLRNHTQDMVAVTEVIKNNCYKLPAYFSRHDLVIDIGAHIGSFAISCLGRGVGNLWAYECDQDNLKFLRQNLSLFAGVTITDAAVWRSDKEERVLFSGYPRQHNACGSCLPGCLVAGVNKKIPVDTISLDRILEEVGPRRVRLLKIDCEGAEFPILGTCTKLDKVDEICGEVHHIAGLGEHMGLPMFKECTDEELQNVLCDKGFDYVDVEPQKSTRASLFWARRGEPR